VVFGAQVSAWWARYEGSSSHPLDAEYKIRTTSLFVVYKAAEPRILIWRSCRKVLLASGVPPGSSRLVADVALTATAGHDRSKIRTRWQLQPLPTRIGNSWR
jgi:hypothetical protein